MTRMTATAIDTGPLRRAPAMLREVLDFCTIRPMARG